MGPSEPVYRLLPHLLQLLLLRLACELVVLVERNVHPVDELVASLDHVLDLVVDQQRGNVELSALDQLIEGILAQLHVAGPLGFGHHARPYGLPELFKGVVAVTHSLGELVVKVREAALLDLLHGDAKVGLLAGNGNVEVVVRYGQMELEGRAYLRADDLPGEPVERQGGLLIYRVLGVVGIDYGLLAHVPQRRHGDTVAEFDSPLDGLPDRRALPEVFDLRVQVLVGNLDLLLLHPDVQVAAQVYGGREGNGGLQGYGREGDKLHSGRARDFQLLLGDCLVRDRGEYVVEGLGHEGLPAEDSFDYRAGSLTLAESGNVRPLDDPAISPFEIGCHVLVL